jgi:hypothetical protein
MAEGKKKDKGGNPGEGRGKSDGGFFKKIFGRLMESAGSQAISDWTRPFIEKIPIGIIQALGRIQVQKVLPYISIAITSALPKGRLWSDKLGDFMNEFTAELRQRINIIVGGEEPAEDGKVKIDKKAVIGAVKTIFKVLFAPELAENLEKNLATLDRIMTGRPDKEQAVIYDILGSMSERELVIFFDQMSDATADQLNIFFKRFLPVEEKKKDEKTFKQIVKELKRDIHEFSKGSSALKELGQEVWEEILGPIWKTVDGWFAEGTVIRNQVCAFRQKTTSFRERVREFRERQRNG